MKHKALFALLLLLGLLLAGCSGQQPQLTAGLDLYDASKAAPIEKLTEQDLADYLVYECGTDGFCKVIIYARDPQNPNGVERFYRSSEVAGSTPVVTPVGTPQATPQPGQVAQDPGQAESTTPAEMPEVISWLDRVLLGQWQIWLLIALAVAGSYALYNWTFKTTPKQAAYNFEDIPTRQATYSFGSDMTVYHIPARDEDRANAFLHLDGKTQAAKLEEAESQIRAWLESGAQERAALSDPEDVDAALRSWIKRINEEVKNVNWANLDGSILEGFPECGRDIVRVRIDGFRPSDDFKNFLNKVKEASKHTEAINELIRKLGISKKEAITLYVEFNKTDALRDVGNSAAAIVAAIVSQVRAGGNQ